MSVLRQSGVLARLKQSVARGGSAGARSVMKVSARQNYCFSTFKKTEQSIAFLWKIDYNGG
ncbi:MAG TPA: hypothetical protein H9737_00245 [Candidatus Borkfalkia faecigallinarum]|uniref:Uncharacterized protein n=1 Tax=Candidatus Borkfalkia faecigallinarum TaxID=2838509 RepID=A0A9D2AQF1_9FIRM|nr:hypothetical protein [Candidatus Borkfalkia faecigallinarum]